MENVIVGNIDWLSSAQFRRECDEAFDREEECDKFLEEYDEATLAYIRHWDRPLGKAICRLHHLTGRRLGWLCAWHNAKLPR
jgi:hypothetical protein